jgi:hypothetical protein
MKADRVKERRRIKTADSLRLENCIDNHPNQVIVVPGISKNLKY